MKKFLIKVCLFFLGIVPLVSCGGDDSCMENDFGFCYDSQEYKDYVLRNQSGRYFSISNINASIDVDDKTGEISFIIEVTKSMEFLKIFLDFSDSNEVVLFSKTISKNDLRRNNKYKYELSYTFQTQPKNYSMSMYHQKLVAEL